MSNLDETNQISGEQLILKHLSKVSSPIYISRLS